MDVSESKRAAPDSPGSDPQKASSFGGIDTNSDRENPAPAQAPIECNPRVVAAIAALQRDFASEAACLNAAVSARAAAIKLTHFADDLGLGLYREADSAFEAARQYAREAAQHLKKLHEALDAEAADVLAEALYTDLADGAP